jgi:flagellar FliL protein
LATEEEPQEAAPKKKSKLPLILGLVLFLALGGGGFYAVFSGMILGPADSHAEQEEGAEALPEIAFLPVDPLTITIGAGHEVRHLRFVSQIEVGKAYSEEVTHLMPRILDVLNGYLRAIDPAELEDPSALVRVRAQILRRIQIVTGEGRVRDLLITEYILN